MKLGDLFTNYDVQVKPTVCLDCGKKCKSRRGCLITQIVNEINKERETPIQYMAIFMKLPKTIPDEDIAYALSESKSKVQHVGGFSKCLFGMLKVVR